MRELNQNIPEVPENKEEALFSVLIDELMQREEMACGAFGCLAFTSSGSSSCKALL